jgi:hypothetical protein
MDRGTTDGTVVAAVTTVLNPWRCRAAITVGVLVVVTRRCCRSQPQGAAAVP